MNTRKVLSYIFGIVASIIWLSLGRDQFLFGFSWTGFTYLVIGIVGIVLNSWMLIDEIKEYYFK